MNPALIELIAQYVLELVQMGPTIIKDIQDTKPFAEAIVMAISGKTPTQADIDTLDAKLTELSTELQGDLPSDV